MKYNVVEIFKSIEGEGKRTGYPAVFVRLAGCNLRCSYCDTPYAQTASDATECLNERELVDKISEYNCSRVTITGGELYYTICDRYLTCFTQQITKSTLKPMVLCRFIRKESAKCFIP
jgi:organic radical activating enzyme